LAFGNQLDQIHFPPRQAVFARLRPSALIQRLSLPFGKTVRNDLAENHMPLVDFPNRFAQKVGGSLFGQKSNRAASTASLNPQAS
jgi:hypothetical protein